MSELIKGCLVDEFSRCEHWHSEIDVIALKFKCCPTVYYPCYSCHEETTPADHKVEKYDLVVDKDKNLVICGMCKTEMTFDKYRNTEEDGILKCYNCKAHFNPGCKLHYKIYFDNLGEEVSHK